MVPHPLVKQFEQARSHRHYSLDYHFDESVRAFDRLYEETIGPLWSPEHEQSRKEYVAYVANQIIYLYGEDDDESMEILTTPHSELPNRSIDVESKSKVGLPKSGVPSLLQRLLHFKL